MCYEETLNWTLAACLYMHAEGDAAWFTRNGKNVASAVESILARDANGRRGYGRRFGAVRARIGDHDLRLARREPWAGAEQPLCRGEGVGDARVRCGAFRAPGEGVRFRVARQPRAGERHGGRAHGRVAHDRG